MVAILNELSQDFQVGFPAKEVLGRSPTGQQTISYAIQSLFGTIKYTQQNSLST